MERFYHLLFDRNRRFRLSFSGIAERKQEKRDQSTLRNQTDEKIIRLKKEVDRKHSTLKENLRRVFLQFHHQTLLRLQRLTLPLHRHGMGRGRRHLFLHKTRLTKSQNVQELRLGRTEVHSSLPHPRT